MKNYTITVNGNVYEVTVEEGTQVTDNQRAKNRHLQQAILIAAELLAADDNDRRLGNPRQQRQANKPRRQRARHKAAVLQHFFVIPAQLF